MSVPASCPRDDRAGADVPSRSVAAAAGRPAPRPSRLALYTLLLALALAVAGLVASLYAGSRRAREALPVLGTLDAFELVDETGAPFGSRALEGRVWVAGFIFTRCPTICPATSAILADLQERAGPLAPRFGIVSFTVDPAFDTPARLAAYARRFRARPDVWKFVTGDLDALKATITDGLKIAMGDIEGEQDFASVFHGTHFVLVDGERRIRGYYASSLPGVAERLRADAARLLQDPEPRPDERGERRAGG